MRVNYLILALAISINLCAQEINLQYFINQALRNNPQLSDYRNQIGINKIDSLQIHAKNGFQVSAVSNNYYAPVIDGWGYDEIVTDIANITAQLSVNKEITGRSNLMNQYRLLQAENQSLVNSYILAEKEIIKDITIQYINAYGSYREYLYNREVLNLLQQQDVLIRRLTEQNTFSQAEYLTFLIALGQQKSKTIEAAGQYRNDLSSLNYLCGILDTTSVILPEPLIDRLASSEAKNSEYYKAFINDSLKLSIRDRQVDFSYRPKVSLFGDAGYYSSWMFQPWKNFGASAGISFTMPIYDGRQRKMEHDKIYLQEQTRLNYKNYFVNQFSQQLFQLSAQISNNEKVSTVLSNQVDYSKALIDADHKLLETGDIRITEYILAINNYLEIRQALIKNSIERNLLITQFNYWSGSK
ncbi:MAG TPA: TolC family protein [Bacteroidales bacterium]|nr:TolC family protein [Bacteroidales bacterium]